MATTVYELKAKKEDGSDLDGPYCTSGDVIRLEATPDNIQYVWSVEGGDILELQDTPTDNPVRWSNAKVHWDTASTSGIKKATVQFLDSNDPTKILATIPITINIRQSPVTQQVDSLPVSMRRASNIPSKDQGLWAAIRNRTKAIRFEGSGYNTFISKVLGAQDTSDIDNSPVAKVSQNAKVLRDKLDQPRLTPVQGVDPYELLKTATQVFLLIESGVVIEEKDRYTQDVLYDPSQEYTRQGRSRSFNEAKKDLENYLVNFVNVPHLPYLVRVITSVFGSGNSSDFIFNVPYLKSRAIYPSMLELIWSYWLEEGMLVQTMNAICMRFQNRRNGSSKQDPLAHMEIAPLYSISSLLWGHIQDEINRLSIQRRAYEYDHHYGLTLYGKAIPNFNPADSRSKFLEAFHNLLFTAATFYKRDDDTTVVADGFPLLNALKELHLILSQGMHNQFGDLPWTARVEMLMQQYILARPEMRKFLQSREMVTYKEGWMAQVDTMKTLQSWTDVSVTHFHTLAEFGEQLLLSIRYGDWVNVEDSNQASNWARYWRPEIQGYVHSYRAATGVDLVSETRDSQQLALFSTQPGILLKQRLTEGSNRILGPVVENAQLPGFRNRRQQSTPRQLP